MRPHVLEVVRPFFGLCRVVNIDNYYTSVQQLQELILKSLYGGDTVHSFSKHFTQHTILNKEDCQRGDYRLGVSVSHNILTTSWCDGNVVTMVSNADISSVPILQRRLVGSLPQAYTAPTCLAQYNFNMQGVDRQD